jgi:hypothetical protein
MQNANLEVQTVHGALDISKHKLHFLIKISKPLRDVSKKKRQTPVFFI